MQHKRTILGASPHVRRVSDKKIRKKVIHRWLLVRFFLIIVVMCYLFVLLEAHTRPILHAIIAYESNRYAVSSFNQAVEQHLAQTQDLYRGLYQLTWDENQNPAAMVADGYDINLLRCQLVREVQLALYRNKQNVYQFHVGRLTGVQPFASLGPVLTLNMEPESYVIANIYHEIESQGDNQTLFSVYATITVQINVSMAGYLQSVTVENKVLLWQNLLLGRVPDVNL